MKDKIILHLDMNSYFASVEQQANPFLRGKPLGVCAYLSDNGCIIASSREAKKLGIKTGCRVRAARQIYPQIILLQNEPIKYRDTTQKIFSILEEYTDTIETYSIDEAFLDLTGLVKGFSEAEKTGKEIKKRIKKEVGEWLKCSMGISYTRFLAKLVSDNIGPDELKILKPRDLENFLNNLKLTDAWGINTQIEARLSTLGIYNLIDLKKYPVANLLRVLKKWGYYLWANVNGLEVEAVKSKREPKSVGHSYCVPQREYNLDYFKKIYMKLCEKTGRRLRELNKEAQGLSVYWAYEKGGGEGKSFKTKTSFYDSLDIFKKVWQTFLQFSEKERIYLLAVSVFNLTPLSFQLSFFEDEIRKKRLIQSLDQINDKFGEYTVIRGTMWRTEKAAPDRIGFRKSISLLADK